MTTTATRREHRPITLPRDPAVVLTVANVFECDVTLAREVAGTPLDLGGLSQTQGREQRRLRLAVGRHRGER